MHALVIDNTIQYVGPLPRTARRLSDGSWVTPPDGEWTPEQAAESGYFPVTETPRPDDTATTTHERDYDLVNGAPTVIWKERPWTQQELTARSEDTNANTIRERAALALESNADFLELASPTNAQALTQIRRLTRQVQGLIRLELRALDTTDHT